MQTLRFPHLPSELEFCHVALFEDYTQAEALRARLIAASKMEGPEGTAERARLDFAFLDARMIASRTHLVTAVHNALLAAGTGQLRTPKVSSEIIWMLSLSPNLIVGVTPSSQIADALRRFGVGPATTAVLVVKVCSADTPRDRVAAGMRTAIGDGRARLAALDTLGHGADWPAIRKAYKIERNPALNDRIASNEATDHLVVTSIGARAIL